VRARRPRRGTNHKTNQSPKNGDPIAFSLELKDCIEWN
jgi:hypothetical protein